MSDEHPIMLDLEPGTYYWCSCGKTKNQPFCDGSHEGTSFLPTHPFYRWNLPSQKKSSMRCATVSAPRMLPIAMGRMKIFRSLKIQISRTRRSTSTR